MDNKMREVFEKIVARFGDQACCSEDYDLFEQALSAIASSDSGKRQEPIYQVWCFDGGWRDVPKEVYEKESHRDDVRIVYTRPQPATIPEGWRRMEYAPKDGTTLLMKSKKGRIASGEWMYDDQGNGGWSWPLVHQDPVAWMEFGDNPPISVATQNSHGDDIAVDDFAQQMKRKLAGARQKGRSDLGPQP